MAKLRKTLPKNLPELMAAAAEQGDDAAVRRVLERCAPDARGGVGAGTPLMMAECTAELAAWLVARGTAVDATNQWGRTALHEAAARRFGHRLGVEDLLALGADVHATSREGLTPLHSAADGKHLAAVQALLRHGAEVDARSARGLTPLEYALMRVTNHSLSDLLPVAEALLNAGAAISEAARGYVRDAAARLEFHRPPGADASVDEAAMACAALCARFDVEPAAPRRRHDGVSPIVAQAATWQAQHAELWDLLVPSHGPCATVQGEVVRITGRVSDELYRNGGANWDAQYRAMVKALVDHLGKGTPLDAGELAELMAAVQRLPDPSASRELARLAVRWVALNPSPAALGDVGYTR